jgi:hypothetical protein
MNSYAISRPDLSGFAPDESGDNLFEVLSQGSKYVESSASGKGSGGPVSLNDDGRDSVDGFGQSPAVSGGILPFDVLPARPD